MAESLSTLTDAEVIQRLREYGVSNLGDLVRTGLTMAQNAAETSDVALASDVYIHQHFVFYHGLQEEPPA